MATTGRRLLSLQELAPSGPSSARRSSSAGSRTARIGHAASQIDRIIAAELGAVDLGMGDEGGAVAFVAEAPDRARSRGLEVRQTLDRDRIGEIGHGIETLDREPRIAVDHHPF